MRFEVLTALFLKVRVIWDRCVVLFSKQIAVLVPSSSGSICLVFLGPEDEGITIF